MKVFQDSGLKSVLTTLLSKIMWGYVTLFQIEKYQLVYWINVREWHKYTPTPQQFWKLTIDGLKFNFKMHVTGCLSIMKH